ncbi:hypothetical protein N7510_005004 [Penicillium lagena]|uniref:uncharacterized protein n=1 Tax=Penicillium lagena TaxID=94218 RepID=UPI002541D2A4|nr:uncharacterized protein N7510_005004 [Penicillium lagena]KAJ5621020.1 hypothetical protein N7510_005004 [Penicillium lagena]
MTLPQQAHDAVAPFVAHGDDGAEAAARFALDDDRSVAGPVPPMYRSCIAATRPSNRLGGY